MNSVQALTQSNFALVTLIVIYLSGAVFYAYPSMWYRGYNPKYALIWPLDIVYGLSPAWKRNSE